MDYMVLISRFDAEERASRGEQVVLPEPAGEQVVDYLAVSKLWKEEKFRYTLLEGFSSFVFIFMHLKEHLWKSPKHQSTKKLIKTVLWKM